MLITLASPQSPFRSVMRLRSWTRLPRSSTIRILCSIFVLWNVFDVVLVYWRCARAAQRDPVSLTRGQKIYIASIHWNNEDVLRRHWVQGVFDLAKQLGRDNVFVSVQESGSWDDSKGALRLLDSMLDAANIPRNIILDPTTHADEIRNPVDGPGWIQTPRDRLELRRIPYLSRLRNLVLEPLYELAKEGIFFDRVLFINDVVFEVADIARLLDTRGGNYAAACALDFSKPPRFYDTFALRDSSGHEALMQTWPYFRSSASRSALKASQPVPVASCWNGITVMDSEPFYNTTHPLRFRGVPDTLAAYHLEGSECCLIHADNGLSAEKGVWLNPSVRVGYNRDAYIAVNPASPHWLSIPTIFLGSWHARFRRWTTSVWFKEYVVRLRLSKWSSQEPARTEPGLACLINEMQVLVENGWAHV